MDNSYLADLISEQQNFANFRSKSFITDSIGIALPQRIIYSRLYGYFDEYLDSPKNPRWITFTGVRGSGKTTLLFQLYNQIQSTDYYRLFLSLDHTHGLLGLSLSDVLTFYETILGMNYEKLDKPLVLFIDEAQYDPQWFLILQGLLDRSEKIFIFVAGSTALRSATYIDPRYIQEIIYPVSSPEYIKITKQKFQIPGLGESIRDAIFYSADSETLYMALQHIAPEVNTYYK